MSPIESSFLNWVVASSCIGLSLLHTPATMEGRFSNWSETEKNEVWLNWSQAKSKQSHMIKKKILSNRLMSLCLEIKTSTPSSRCAANKSIWINTRQNANKTNKPATTNERAIGYPVNKALSNLDIFTGHCLLWVIKEEDPVIDCYELREHTWNSRDI